MYALKTIAGLISFIVLIHPVPGASLTTERVFPLAQLKEGDAVRITFFPDSGNFINGDYTIDDAGKILLPLLGKSAIRDKSESDILDFLNKSFAEQLRYPNAQIEPLIRISFLGGFIRPGLFYINPSSSLFEALHAAGGPLREDGFRMMKWERKGEVLQNDLTPLLESGVSLYKMGVESGDQISVTTRPKKYSWDKFNQDALPLLTFMVSSVTASIAIYSTIRLLQQD